MSVKERNEGDVMVLDLSGEININTSPDVRKCFDKLIKEQKKKILLNFEEVGYIDSSGLATMVEMMQRMKRFGGTLRLTNLTDKVRGLFEITKLDRLFGIFPSEEEALKDF
ncbi:MAG: STAS domain-containing protein [Candidatus Omnitrophica bacterium]|nr:STAS domain-containing protein [Candidatus Omnitrophota bacterium]